MKANTLYENFALVLAGYGIAHVLVQDLGVTTSKGHMALFQLLPVQILLMYSGAFALVRDARLAAASVCLYFMLSYVWPTESAQPKHDIGGCDL